MRNNFTLLKLRSLAAAVCFFTAASGAVFAQVQVGGQTVNRQRPGLIDPTCGTQGGPAVGSAACDSQEGREWEGIASTDYYTFESTAINPPDPDIAVGPDDIVTIVNRIIARYPNPNAPTTTDPTGRAAVNYSPAGTYLYPPTSRQFLDVWLGETALAELCPTQPRSFASCVIGNASVRYDQMQGRFLVLFTVVDTALVNGFNGNDTAGANAGTRRKASWVLIASRWATGCQGSQASSPTNIGGACTPNTNPAAAPLTGNTEFFTTPQPPGTTQASPNSGGLNTNWVSIYSAQDGFCQTPAADLSTPAARCPHGNINSISDNHRRDPATLTTNIDCSVQAGSAIANTTNVCMMPASARLGIDNDNIIITSSVYDDNVNLPTRVTGTTAWMGTRTRILKKTAVYSGVTSLPIRIASPTTSATVTPTFTGSGSSGDEATDAVRGCPTYGSGTSSSPAQLFWLCPGAAILPVNITGATDVIANATGKRRQGDYYDMWELNPTTPTGPYAGENGVKPLYVHDHRASVDPKIGLNFEPVHVRGRALASYTGNANQDGASTNLIGAVWNAANITTAPEFTLAIRTIRYNRTDPAPLGPNTGPTSATTTSGKILGGLPSFVDADANAVNGLNRFYAPVPGFRNPESVVQRARLSGTASTTPFLYVGDNRPHRVVMREGHLYDARVAQPFITSGQGNVFGQVTSEPMYSTVVYDIIQKLGASTPPRTILSTNWSNGNFYAPMFDITANVIQYGSISPINLQPFLEKLFVGTTYPALAPTDPRVARYGYTQVMAAALQACTGMEPSVTTAGRAYPGLFDMRCGEDAFDTQVQLRHPVNGGFGNPAYFGITDLATCPDATTTVTASNGRPCGTAVGQIVPFGIRGGAATDPVNLGLWTNGAYAKGRLAAAPGFGQWGTYVAHYPMTFPIRDQYNNLISTYSDVSPSNPFYTFIQVAKQTEIIPGGRTDTTFNVNGLVTRADMATWTIRAQMDEAAITSYLNQTGGVYCSFADVSCPSIIGNVPDDVTKTNGGGWRYIEAMYRRGYTKGCETSNDGQRRFCPTRNLSRGEMAVFLIRAKMNSVFPTVTSGAATTPTCSPTLGTPSEPTQVTQVGDQYGLYTGCTGYFSDVPNTHPFYTFIQKLRELRISNGRTLPAAGATQGTYDPDGTLTRGELMTFLVRAFMP